MATFQDIVETGKAHHLAGRLPEAEALYRAALDVKPGAAEPFHLLGVMAHHRGADEAALALFAQAAALDGQVTDYQYSAGVAHRRLGRLGEAAARFRRTLVLDPGHADAWTSLGHVASALGHAEPAVVAYRRALAVAPQAEGTRSSLVALLHRLRRLDEAITVLAAGPDAGEAGVQANIGILHKQAGRLDAALRAFRAAVLARPDLPAALTGMADIFLLQFRTVLAEVWARLAGAIAPVDGRVQETLARVYEQQGRHADAAQRFRRAVALEPAAGHLYFNLGMMLENQGLVAEAVGPYDRSLQLDPGLAHAYEKIGLKHTLCDWRTYDADVARMLGEVRRGGKVPPLPLLYVPSPPADHLTNARAVLRADLEKTAAARAGVRFAHERAARDRITVGYVSGDLREHAVAFLIAELFELHDRNRFQVLGYCTGPDRAGQPMRKRMEAAFDRLTVIRDLGPVEAAQRIRNDGVDILVDLSGHTRYNRHDVFALRPAPVQVNYLGYPGTVGADFIDYVLADPVVAPFEHQPYFAERIVQLPHCYQANDRKRACDPGRPTRAECGLPEGAFVFCCFNNTAKFTPHVFDAWMRLLRAVPGSVLWLLHSEPAATANLRRAAAERGVDPARLIFAPRVAPALHLPRLPLADLFLDTAPYNAHTTGSDALWMGLPLVTFLGDGFAGRVGASLLRAAGLPELITASLAEYEALALALARDPQRLAGLRARLVAGRDACPLFDMPRFARHVEQAYERMWRTWVAGEAPQPFAVTPVP